MKEAVVVGSGISGLTVAYWLKKRGVEVTVFEKDDTPGGTVKTEREGDFLLEIGPQTVLTNEALEELLRELNLKPIEATPHAKERFIYKKGKLIPLPKGPFSFITSPLLSLKGKLKVLKEPWVPPSEREEESVAQFVRRRLGEEFLRYVVGPFISGVYAGDPEELSVKYATPKIYQLEKEYGSLIKGAIKKRSLGPKGKIISFEGGLKDLIDRLTREVEVSLENVVLRIRKKDEKFILDTRRGKVESRVVVVASPAYTSSYLLKDLSWSASLEFDKIDYVPVAVVHLSVKKGSIPKGFGFLVPRGEGKRILGALFSSVIFPHVAPQDKDLITVYMGGATDRGIVEEDQETLGQIAKKEVEEILKTEAQILRVTLWKKAIPQYKVGHGKFLDLAREMEDIHKGLFLTGNYLHGVSLADCVKSSKEVAERVESFLKG